jgi:hypothetical protein
VFFFVRAVDFVSAFVFFTGRKLVVVTGKRMLVDLPMFDLGYHLSMFLKENDKCLPRKRYNMISLGKSEKSASL